MLCERNPHPQALLQDSPHFAAHTLLPDHVSQLICSSFFQDQNPGGGKKKISFLHLLICVYFMFYRKASQTQLDMSMANTTDENNSSYFATDSSYSPTPLPLIANPLRHNLPFSLCLCSIYHGVTCDRPSGCCHCTSAGSCIPPLHPSDARNEGEQLENTTV